MYQDYVSFWICNEIKSIFIFNEKIHKQVCSQIREYSVIDINFNLKVAKHAINL